MKNNPSISQHVDSDYVVSGRGNGVIFRSIWKEFIWIYNFNCCFISIEYPIAGT